MQRTHSPTPPPTDRRLLRRALVGIAVGIGLLGGAALTAPGAAGRAESAALVVPAIAATALDAEVRRIREQFPDEGSSAPRVTPGPRPLTDRITERDLPPSRPPLACPATGRAAVADKTAQRFWLCRDGVAITGMRPMTTGSAEYGLPPIGVHPVFAKLEVNRGITGERLERFVAFYRTPSNNRIAFHQYVNQDPATIGDPSMRVSAGCFRLTVDDSWLVWDFLQIGDPVIVISP